MSFATRPRFDWHLRTHSLALGQHTRVMGILNVTPDSFSDGGHFYSPANETERAVTHALTLLNDGAHIIDIGGESTRPNATPLSPDEEQARILPVIIDLLKAAPDTILSIDTYNASSARHAIAAGAEIINDVSGLQWDPTMPDTCAKLACGVVLMHSRGTPQTWKSLDPLLKQDLLPHILSALDERATSAVAAGIHHNRIVLDPGFGFGKLGEENYTLHAHLGALHVLNLPLLTGTSRKSFLRQTLESLGPIHESATPVSASGTSPSSKLLSATTASNVAAILAGAHLIRVHDPRPAREAAAIADAILNAK